jgi:hypothetical protein
VFPVRYELNFYILLHKDYEHKGSVAKKKPVVVILKGLGAKMN